MDKKALSAVAMSIRSLSMDAIEKAKSGHPGLPLGCAEFGATLFGEILSHTPEDPSWLNRDRFVLSAGHGSMFLYSLLHLSGYGLSVQDITAFRQLGSKTPGHPEYGWTDGVETTTGPLGQGFANAVGMAIAEKSLAARFNTTEHQVVDHYTYALSGDGCLMEGISYEAAALAGHLKLGKLIVFYDSNRITIEGHTDLAWSEDVQARFIAAGWQVQSIDAYDLDGIMNATNKAKAETGKPSLIIMRSIIGKGSPNKADSHEVHGAPLGPDEIIATRKAIGIPEGQTFYVAPEAYEYFKSRRAVNSARKAEWETRFAAWKKANPAKALEWEQFYKAPGEELAAAMAAGKLQVPAFALGDSVATRVVSGKMINALAAAIPNFMGGSADLSPSNNTEIKGGGSFSADNPLGRIMHFGIREHAMGAISNGIILHGGLRPFCATFLVFADYMRPTIRLAALMKLGVIYVFTHDSIFVGEDGPTHQPIEHLASLRIIPGVQVLRPADAEETIAAWTMAMARGDGPTALLLTRQNLTVFAKPAGWQESLAAEGAYVVSGPSNAQLTLVSGGSELGTAMEAATKVQAAKPGTSIRIVSVLSREKFLSLPQARLDALLGSGLKVVIEAGVRNGWEGIASTRDCLITLDEFGHSGPGKDVADHMGISAGKIAARLQALI